MAVLPTRSFSSKPAPVFSHCGNPRSGTRASRQTGVMVIMLAVRETGANAAFPSYETISRLANVSSRSTIARAIAILRASRWLTLCGRLRKASGRFRGNVYALHDEPLPLADVIHLDGDYMAFLNKAVSHGHARVRTVAKGVLASIDEDVRAGVTYAPWSIQSNGGCSQR